MSEALQKVDSKLPTLQELYDDSDKSDLQKAGIVSVLLNSEPKPSWIQVNKFANNSRYIGIGTLEWLMTYVWRGRWHVETKGYSLIANAVACEVRVHYFDWTSKEWRFTDGIGAAPLQLDSAKEVAKLLQVTELEAQTIIRSNPNAYIKGSAVQMALPAAESFAFKDATEKLGRIFGKDLNRRDAVDYLSLLGQFETDPVTISAEEAATITTLLEKKGSDLQKLLKWIGAETLSGIKKSDYNKVITKLI